MASRVWTGSTGDFYDLASWTTTSDDPDSYPLPGDTALIATGTVLLLGSEAKNSNTFDNVSVTLGSVSAPAAVLKATSRVLVRAARGLHDAVE